MDGSQSILARFGNPMTITAEELYWQKLNSNFLREISITNFVGRIFFASMLLGFLTRNVKK